ncbi:hypothetical protein [Streptomyces sp. NPDC091416]|uniref:hypothetical protein n=1 Tax=Streptomyces sp. NPDC091416 TaxID=3366003 RepID=UPI003806A3C9
MTAALVDVLWFIEGKDDEQMDPADAVKVLEGVTHLVSTLPSDQRSELIGLTEAESDPARKEFLEGFPEGLGLLDDAG